MHACKRMIVVFCFFLLAACGYHMAGKETHVPRGISSVAIPTFQNHTFEPGIEISFTQAFLNEFIRDRRVQVVDRREADSILEGAVKSFSVASVSYNRSFYVTEYQTTVVLDLTLKRRTGEILWTEKGLSETRWYRTSSSVLENEANKAAAIQQLGRFVAERMRNRFFYQF
jgi:outer membrane lipopolysaccharide assembly protein LptE/RlpB